MWSFVTSFFHLTCFPGSFNLPHISVLYTFLQLNNIPLYGCTTICISIYLFIDGHLSLHCSVLNIHGHIFGHIFSSLGYISSSGIVGLYGILVFCGCFTIYHNFNSFKKWKLILETRVQNQGVSRAGLPPKPLRRIFPRLFQLMLAPGGLCFVAAWRQPLRPASYRFLFWFLVSSLPFLKRIVVNRFRPIRVIQNDLLSRFLITSVVTLFLNKVTFTGFRY